MIKQLTTIVGRSNIKENFSLSECTSFGIGGQARYFVTPDSISALFSLIDFVEEHNLRCKIIGNGTNLLFDDAKFEGIVVSTKKLASVTCVGDRNILACCGTSLASLVALAQQSGMTGLEFAVGIPGSVGGAIVMNAGAGGSEMSAIVKSVTVFENGDIRCVPKGQLEFSYRSSYFSTHPMAVILFAEFELTQEPDRQKIAQQMQSNLNKRLSSQPREKSAGCVFKKCGEDPAGLLIDKAGLKNLRVGGARVSDVHANFIVNDKGATANDVKELIELIKLEVWKKFGKKLELEIEIIV